MSNDEKYLKIKECELIIYKLISKYSAYYSKEDLYQAGCIGVIKACNKYKGNNNVKFSTYAYKYILGEIIDFIRKDKNIIISDEMYSLYRQYVRVKELLSSKYQKEVSFDEICTYIDIDKEGMLRIIESVSFAKSIEEDEKLYNDIFVDNREELDNSILIEDALESLNEFEKSIIDYRYYMGYTQMQTADILGISQVKVSRNEKIILSKIKERII